MEVQAIKKYMKEKKITYDELAARSGLSISTIKKIFSGISQYPRIDTMAAIETALELNQSPVQFTDEEKAAGVGAHGTVLSDEEWEIIELFSELERIKGKNAVNAVKTMIKSLCEEK